MTTARARNSFKNQRVTRQPGEWGFSERAPCVSKSGDALIQYSLRAQLYNTWLCAGTGENGRESLLLLLPPGMKTLQIKKKKKNFEKDVTWEVAVFVSSEPETLRFIRVGCVLCAERKASSPNPCRAQCSGSAGHKLSYKHGILAALKFGSFDVELLASKNQIA